MNATVSDSAPDEISMRASLYKTEHLFGMEPFLAKLFIGVGLMMGLVFQQQLSYIVAILIATVGLQWLRHLGKVDLQWSSVFIRATRWKRFYPATSYVNVKRPHMRKQQREKRNL
jgi:hypothetical protein